MEIIEGTATTEQGRPYRFKLEVNKGMKNQYGWTVRVESDDQDAAHEEMNRSTARLNTDYPNVKGE